MQFLLQMLESDFIIVCLNGTARAIVDAIILLAGVIGYDTYVW